MKQGFIKVAAAVPLVSVGDCDYNVEQTKALIAEADKSQAEIVVFPELSLVGYTCQDLFRQHLLLDSAETAIVSLLDFTRQLDIISIIGIPVVVGDLLLNCAAVIQHGKLLGLVPKTYLPNYSEFYEKRWFASSQDLRSTEIVFAGNKVTVTSEPQLFRTADGVKFGIEICEDVWAPTPPSNRLALAGAEIIFNQSASDELVGKHNYLKGLVAQQSARTVTGYVYSSSGYGESTQDVVYGGNAMIFENGTLLAKGARFSMQPQIEYAQIDVERLRGERRDNSTYVNAQRNLKSELPAFRQSVHVIDCFPALSPATFELERSVEPLPFVPSSVGMESSCEEILNIQSMGLVRRIVHTHADNVIVGVSGGLDSTLALLVCIRAFDYLKLDRKGIVGVTMPGFGTTDRTYNNAITLMEKLGITIREISIVKSVSQHFEDIGHDPSNHDITYENAQARERTQILMDISNQMNGFVVGTGDLSELALGWATYNGDHMSMYGVNASVPKTLVKHLVNYVALTADSAEVRAILTDILNTPISPELVPATSEGAISQMTEDLVGPYELHDFYLYYFLRHGFRPSKIYLLACKAFNADGQKETEDTNNDRSDGSHEVPNYSKEEIKHWMKVFFKRFFAQQFKRSCMPDGPKIGSVSLSPRGDWRMPSDAQSALWIKECDSL